uniref:ABC-type xenobiotic transporter n=1 Tax=Ditylenchus dipsaci TaxID=166011 RepID=A0A915CZ45_9BILA
MGARKPFCRKFFCYKRKKDAGDHLYEAASFYQMMRYASTTDWCLVGAGMMASLLTGLPYALHCYNFGGICDVLMEGQFTYDNGTFDIAALSTKVMVHVWRFFFIGVAEFVLILITMISFYTVSILNQDMPWFDKNEVGALTQKMNSSIEKINSGMSDKCAIILQAISNIIIGVSAGFFMCWQLTLLLVLLSPFMSFSMYGSVKFIGTSLRKEIEAYASAGGVAEEVISGIRTVAAFTAQPFEAKRYESFLKAGKKMGVYKALIVGFFSGLFLFVIFGCMSIAFWYGTTLVLSGTMSAGMVFGVFWLVIDGAIRLGAAIPQMSIVSAAKLAAGELFSIIDRTPALDSSDSSGKKLENLEGKVEFSDIHFNYPSRPDVKVLQGISFLVNPGETVALIGPSGCGKSTIVSLLMRYYTFSQGALTIDGVPIEELNVEWLRNTIGVVSQQPVLFATTVEENLKLGKENATLKDMIQACKTANAHEFISKLPKGYQTLIGEGGVKLSGGQKQRLAIARALIRNPRILLLDEATSALDTESELIVQQAINQASAGRTTITIAHRLSTIRNANKILVVVDGKIFETGTHEELYQKNGVYSQLLKAQDMSSGLDDQKKDEDVDFSDDEQHSKQHGRRREFSRSSSRDSTREFVDLTRISDAIRGSMTSIKHAVEYEECSDQPEKQMKKASLLEIVHFCREEYSLLVPGLLLTIIRGCSWPVFAILYGRSFQTLTNAIGLADTDEIASECLVNAIGFMALGIISGLTTFGSGALFGIVGEKMSMRLRMYVFKNILRQDGSYFDNMDHSTGKLTSRLATDASNVQAAIDHRLAQVIQGWVSLIVGISVAFYFGWNVAIFGVAIMLALIIVQFIVAASMKRRGIKLVKFYEVGSKLTSEAIENVRTVQALTRQRFLFNKFCDTLRLPHKLALKQGIWQSLSYALSTTFFNFNFAIAYFCGLILIEWGYSTPFTVFQVIESLTMASFTLMMTAAYMPEYLRARIAAGLMFSMMEEKSKIDSESELGKVTPIAGSLAMKNVHFAYPNGNKRLVLNGLSLNAKFGETIALVGQSGCGKSTIASLIERYYDVLSGNLSIDGVDIRQYNVKHLRQSMSIVGQEPTLFNLSIRENIAYGIEQDEVTQKQIEEAAKLANIHNFVDSLPEKYETSAGGKGSQLSGGQKQRIAIARAIIRDPKILLLDEATSALDTESERLVQEALERAKKGRTCLVIAHRLSTIQHADQIAVIKDGRIVEQGNHQNLLMRKGVYQKLVEKQST